MAVHANLRQYAPALKARFSPAAPFGVGLRLSAREARELLEGDRLRRVSRVPRPRGAVRRHHQRLPVRTLPRHAGQSQRLRARLARRGAGRLHARSRSESCRRCCRRASTAACRRPRFPTKPWMADAGSGAWEAMTRNVVRVAEALVRIRRRAWHAHPPRHRAGARLRSREHRRNARVLRGVAASPPEARCSPRRLASVQTKRGAISRITSGSASTAATSRSSTRTRRRAGAVAGRGHPHRTRAIELGPATSISQTMPGRRSEVAGRLRPFADTTYLHQVVEPQNGGLHHYPDLDVALDHQRSTAPR